MILLGSKFSQPDNSNINFLPRLVGLTYNHTNQKPSVHHFGNVRSQNCLFLLEPFRWATAILPCSNKWIYFGILHFYLCGLITIRPIASMAKSIAPSFGAINYRYLPSTSWLLFPMLFPTITSITSHCHQEHLIKSSRFHGLASFNRPSFRLSELA